MRSKIKCFLGRHEFEFVKELSDQAAKFKCSACQKEIAFNRHLWVTLPWSDELAEFYSRFNTTDTTT